MQPDGPSMAAEMGVWFTRSAAKDEEHVGTHCLVRVEKHGLYG
jgi:hypothetical protein